MSDHVRQYCADCDTCWKSPSGLHACPGPCGGDLEVMSLDSETCSTCCGDDSECLAYAWDPNAREVPRQPNAKSAPPKATAPNMRELAVLFDCTQLSMRMITGFDDDLIECIDKCRSDSDWMEAVISAQKKLSEVLGVEMQGTVLINEVKGGIQSVGYPIEKPGNPNDN